ncbi:hypothetical protein NEIRO02_2579 [Nematocida sp. AWRm79]|nr:hypothetical protein NEIRO02_2579 [Nematocida sp. AWRm79]
MDMIKSDCITNTDKHLYNRKRKANEDISSVYETNRINIPLSIECMVKNSNEYKNYIELMYTYKLTVGNNNENDELSILSYYNQKVDCTMDKDVFPALTKRIQAVVITYPDIWMGLQTIKQESIIRKMGLMTEIYYLKHGLDDIFQQCHFYYDYIHKDLYAYLDINWISSYNTHIIQDLYKHDTIKVKEFTPYNTTLGDIYIKNSITRNSVVCRECVNIVF